MDTPLKSQGCTDALNADTISRNYRNKPFSRLKKHHKDSAFVI